MPDNEGRSNRDLILPPSTYAYIQAENSGAIRTLVGPVAAPISGQEKPIRYNSKSRTFERCGQDEAIQRFAFAGENEYIILENPAGKFPTEGSAQNTEKLQMGLRVVVHGPASFALWPGQSSTTIAGHQLSRKQYLLVRVYNVEEAMKNWPQEECQPILKDGESVKISGETVLAAPDLRLGQLLIIRGDQRSFYIPPTGIEVVPDEKNQFVRDAVTLEQLEYCILVDEDGSKRYERGPAVVFPKPTEKFITDKHGHRRFKAVALPKHSGIHVQVIADADGEKAGDELFIRGDQTPIYFPDANHSIIRYGDQDVHFAVAVPAGEGRYVMNRDTGEVPTVKGPTMLLPDPRKEVIVRRIMTRQQCELYWPDGAADAVAYNESLEAASAEAGVDNRRGVVSDVAYRSSRGMKAAEAALYDAAIAEDEAGTRLMGETFRRKTSFTQPRTLTLDTKYEGVPIINVWTGYAVCVVNKRGARRVVEGPATVLLDYDETLEILELSTGKPKSTDKLQKTVYLRVKNNKVSDIVKVETADHVVVEVKLSFMVNFDGEPLKWFAVENYVKRLCDHIRSVLKGTVQRIKIEDFYSNHVPIIRDAILGKPGEGGKRPLMPFEDNGMVVQDVEILGFTIEDKNVAALLQNAQFAAVNTAVELVGVRRTANADIEKQQITRQVEDARTETAKHVLNRKREIATEEHANTLAVLANRLKEAVETEKAHEATGKANVVQEQAALEIRKLRDAVDIASKQALLSLRKDELTAETDATVKRFEAAREQLSEAIMAMSRDEVAVKVAEAMSVQNIIGGKSFTEAAKKIFEGTPIAGFLTGLGARKEAVPTNR